MCVNVCLSLKKDDNVKISSAHAVARRVANVSLCVCVFVCETEKKMCKCVCVCVHVTYRKEGNAYKVAHKL